MTLDLPEFDQLVRALFLFLLLSGVTASLYSLMRVKFLIKYLPKGRNEVFDRLKAAVRDQEFTIKLIDDSKNRIVTEGIVHMVDLGFLQLWGNRVIFQVSEYVHQQVQLRAYANASFLFFFKGCATFLFSRIKLTRSEESRLITKEKIAAVVDEVMGPKGL